MTSLLGLPITRGRPDGVRYSAVIFDMDGVITDTARVHAIAWQALFDDVLPRLDGPAREPFDPGSDYRRYVDGRTREDGVRAFLAARSVELPEGTADDGPESLTVAALAARKQGFFERELAASGVQVFPDALDLLRRLRADGVPIALVTSSRNSQSVLDAAGIGEVFDVRVDGTDAVTMSLAGKPDPAMFLEAARRLSTSPADAVVVEDATAGVRAGAAGGFALVVGVDRVGARDGRLSEAGADIVLEDLAALDLSETGQQLRLARDQEPWCGGASAPGDDWTLAYDGFDPDQEGTREALCTLGNGYWATRGAVPGALSDAVHNPGTYIAGVFNRVVTEREKREVQTEHLVNAPDWSSVTVRSEAGPVFRPGSSEMLSHRQELDLRHGVLTRTNRYRDAAGRTTRITTRQFQSQSEVQLAALEMVIEAEDWSGTIRVRSAIDGDVVNRNVVADRSLNASHLVPVGSTELTADTVMLETMTNQSGVAIAIGARTVLRGAELQGRRTIVDPAIAGHDFTVAVVRGRPVTIERVAAVATSRDRALSTAASSAANRIRRAPGFAELLGSHVGAWEQLWNRFGVRLQAGGRQSLALNLHIFHVLQTLGSATPDRDAGVPARGLHGEGYRGHIFWDEVFVYPMLTLRRPELTRSLLLYRHRRLNEARAAAREAGHTGAMFPWQSGSDGREETPTELFNTRSGRWMPDNSHRQRHIGLAVAYSVWKYYEATDDGEFLAQYGAEILIEVARLFASLASPNPADGRFDISGVMGPDEFHDGYPGASGEGLTNNAYTNVLASWVLTRALAALDILPDHERDRLRQQLALQQEEPATWDLVSRRLRIPFHADGVISQFEGYENLAEFDWQSYRERYGNIGRLDLILQAEGKSTNDYRLSKQADVLMLFYLFSAEELRSAFDRLGYELRPEVIPATVDYYLARTSHGSTLSRVVSSWVSARGDRARSWSLYEQALDSDLADTQGGSTREGIHLGAMAGTVDLVIRCYSGLETRDGVLWLHPVLPVGLPGISFELTFRRQPISVDITTDEVRLRLHPCHAEPIDVCVENERATLRPGDTLNVALR